MTDPDPELEPEAPGSTAPGSRLDLDPTVDLDALEQAILRARSAELSEVRRRQIRLTAGYGDETAREAMDDEGTRAQARHDALTALLEAVRRARG